MPLGVYFHVPFCAATCDFCAFYQKAPARGELERYLNGMERELKRVDFPRPVDTVFWGGGTPSLLPAKRLEQLGGRLLGKMARPPREWTVEMTPATVTEKKLAVLRDLGVSRISLGVQSFQQKYLERLGSRHSLAQAYRAIERVRAQGFGNLNLDLIFSIPGQSLEDWQRDLEEAVRLGPEHLSTYCLTFEEDTALYLRWMRGKLEPKGEEESAAFYRVAWEMLGEAGFRQYEVSNYARPGFVCRHNWNTWRMGEWLGFGPSAASQFGGRRFSNVPDLEGWLAGVDGEAPAYADATELTPEMLACDCLIFGLRMNDGVNLGELAARFPGLAWEGMDRFWQRGTEAGLIEKAEGQAIVRLTPAGRLVADRVAVEIMAAFESLERLPAAAPAQAGALRTASSCQCNQ